MRLPSSTQEVVWGGVDVRIAGLKSNWMHQKHQKSLAATGSKFGQLAPLETIYVSYVCI